MRTLAALTFVFFAVLFGSPAWADKRVALVIGNSAYQNVPRLVNPSNDAKAIAATFQAAKFDVVVSGIDMSAFEMRRMLRDFADKASDADIAVVYYAGHGIEIDGTNYLIPVDAHIERDTDVYDEAFALDRILVSIESAKQLRLVILDACRDNPFANSMKRTTGTRSIGRGLAKVEPSSPNTLIAFAAKAGSTALDGDSKNSPFASAVVNNLTKPGLDLRKAFGFVRDEVLHATGNRQEPFIYGSLGGNDVSLVPAVAVAPVGAAEIPQARPPTNDARADYELAVAVGTKDVWDAFIANYPSGFYTELAKAQRNRLSAEEARVAATDNARRASDEQARLAAQGGGTADLARAAAQVKAAEDARIASEKKKALEDARVAEAEQAKAVALAKAAEPKAERAISVEAVPDNHPVGPVAALAPDLPTDAPRLLQTELRRVGCYSGTVDGNWTTAAQRSLDLFNKSAHMTLDTKFASLDSLDVVRSKTGRVCPMICNHGYKADGDSCVKITCRDGWEVGDDNTCERIEVRKPTRPTARYQRDEPPPRRAYQEPEERPARSAQRSGGGGGGGSGQVLCDMTGCRGVSRGCHLSSRMTQAGEEQTQVCN